jgi:hypothetical protein
VSRPVARCVHTTTLTVVRLRFISHTYQFMHHPKPLSEAFAGKRMHLLTLGLTTVAARALATVWP